MTQHVHTDLIKAWADGAEIQVYSPTEEWIDVSTPVWATWRKYRIKPAPTINITVGEDVAAAALQVLDWPYVMELVPPSIRKAIADMCQAIRNAQ